MTFIHVPIVRWVDDYNPGLVECLLVDASGRTWSFIDKLPIFTEIFDLGRNSVYPQPGILACEIIEEKVDSEGRNVCVINTGKPWGIESVEGITCFEVLQEVVEVG